jgi:hypothetical protein
MGICQFCNGKSEPVKRLSRGDFVVYYSPKVTMERLELYQRFIAIGRVIDDAPYQIDRGGGFKPFRRNISYFDAKHLDIKPLVPPLSFINNKQSWGYVFYYGFLEIDQDSFETIAKGMLQPSHGIRQMLTLMI